MAGEIIIETRLGVMIHVKGLRGELVGCQFGKSFPIFIFPYLFPDFNFTMSGMAESESGKAKNGKWGMIFFFALSTWDRHEERGVLCWWEMVVRFV